jgi:TolB-like protein
VQASNLSIDALKIREQLSRVLNSAPFKRSAVLSRFLEFIVTETLKGNELTLKEYVIAVSVLNKSPEFNPQLNGIVRIHANRLRKLLDEYYQRDGLEDSIEISIPTGRYIPCFKNRNINDQSTSGNKHNSEKISDSLEVIESKPTVAVLPLTYFQENKRLDVVCSVLCHDLTAELSKFPEIGVITNYSTQCALEKTPDIEKLISNLGVDFLITGCCVLEDDRIRVSAELNDCREHKLLWAESYYLEDLETDWVRGYKKVIQKITAMTGGFFGMIYRNTLNAHVPVNYDCLYAIYWHNRYHNQFTEEAFMETLSAIEKGLIKSPDNALLLALKAELYLNILVMIPDPDKDYLRLGTDLVKKAISRDTTCQHAYQVYAWSNLLNHDQIEIYRSIEKCLSLNPNNPMYLGQMGFGYICAGDYEKGMDLMSESINLNPFYTWNLNLGFAFYFIHSGDFEEALLWAEKVDRRKFLWDPLMRASILGLLEEKEAASKALAEVLAICPNFEKYAEQMVNAFLFDRNLTQNIANGLQFAGAKNLAL